MSRAAGDRVGLTPEQVLVAFMDAGGNEREAGRLLGVSASTVRHHLRRAERPTVTNVNLAGLDPTTEIGRAVGRYIRASLDRVGVRRKTDDRPQD